PQGIADRATAKTIAAEREQQLQQIQATKPTAADYAAMGELQSQQLQHALESAKQANAGLLKNNVFEAFRRYASDGNTKHFNTALADLRNNPIGQNLFPGIVRVDKISKDDVDLQEELGINYALLEQNPELLKEFVKVTKADGTTELASYEGLSALTGYAE